MSEQRMFLQLRAHIDDLIAKGAVIANREPLRLTYGGRVYKIACGMLICED